MRYSEGADGAGMLDDRLVSSAVRSAAAIEPREKPPVLTVDGVLSPKGENPV